MPQDSGPGPKEPADLLAAARRVLEDAKTEPVPERIAELAGKLDDVLAKQRMLVESEKKPV